MTDTVEDHQITEHMLAKAVVSELSVSPGDVAIKSFKVSGGSAKGDNYVCTMKAIEVVALVRGEEKKLHYIAKCVPQSEFRADFVKETGLFQTEVVVYKSILPSLSKLEKSSDRVATFPRHYYASDVLGVIIMENMKLKGWYMADHSAGLTTTQLELVLQQLARLHATSYHFLNTFPGGLEAFKQEFKALNYDTWLPKGEGGSANLDESVDRNFNDFSRSFINIVHEIWPGDKSVIDKLKAFFEVRRDRVDAAHKPVDLSKGINCLLHMDSWTNNFFFRNNPDGAVNEAAIFDMQLMKRGRPCTDLTHLLGTSTTPEFRKQHLDGMLKLYYAEFCSVLIVHGYNAEKMYPLSAFMREFRECSVILFVMAAMGLRIHLNKPDPEDVFKAASEEQQAILEKQNLEMVRGDEDLKKKFVDIVQEAIDYGVLESV